MTGAASTRRNRFGSLYLGFVITGAITSLLGPLLPWLASRSSVGYEKQGLFFLAQFLASTLTTLASSATVQRWGFRRVISIGYAVMALGVTLLALLHWPILLAGPMLYGGGIGFVIPSSNLLAAKLADRSSVALSRLNACWTAGAVVWPWLVASATRGGNVETILLLLAASSLVCGLWMACLLVETTPAPLVVSAHDSTSNSRKVAVALAVLFFLYVGTEGAIAGWVASFTKQISTGSSWALIPSVFWLFLFAGRVSAPVFLRRVSEFSVCVTGLVSAVVGTVILVYAGTLPAIFAGAAIAGLGLSAVFPLLIAALARIFGSPSRTSGVVFASAGIGGAVVPWTVGALSGVSNSIRAGLWIPAATSFLLLGLLGLFRDAFKTPPSGETH